VDSLLYVPKKILFRMYFLFKINLPFIKGRKSEKEIFPVENQGEAMSKMLIIFLVVAIAS